MFRRNVKDQLSSRSGTANAQVVVENSKTTSSSNALNVSQSDRIGLSKHVRTSLALELRQELVRLYGAREAYIQSQELENANAQLELKRLESEYSEKQKKEQSWESTETARIANQLKAELERIEERRQTASKQTRQRIDSEHARIEERRQADSKKIRLQIESERARIEKKYKEQLDATESLSESRTEDVRALTAKIQARFQKEQARMIAHRWTNLPRYEFSRPRRLDQTTSGTVPSRSFANCWREFTTACSNAESACALPEKSASWQVPAPIKITIGLAAFFGIYKGLAAGSVLIGLLGVALGLGMIGVFLLLRHEKSKSQTKQILRLEAASDRVIVTSWETISVIERDAQAMRSSAETARQSELDELDRSTKGQLPEIDKSAQMQLARLKEQEQAVSEIEKQAEQSTVQVKERFRIELEAVQAKSKSAKTAIGESYEDARANHLRTTRDSLGRVAAEWNSELESATSALTEFEKRIAQTAPLAMQLERGQWAPATSMPEYLSLGSVVSEPFNRRHALAVVETPFQLTLGIATTQESRALANRYLESYLFKLLALTPPSRIRFVLVDAVGRGQAFATFMQMIDSERREKANEETIGRRIWTEQREIEERLADLVREMETRIQQRLGNRFKDLTEYNAQAVNPLPWLVLGVANFPHGFSEDAARRLLSIAEHGRPTGILVAFTWDQATASPYRFNNDSLASVVSMLDVQGEHLVARIHGPWQIEPDIASPELIDTVLTRLAIEVPKASVVEVPFSKIEPPADSWQTESTRDGIAVPIGHSGASKRQIFEYSSNRSAYHGVMLGQTGSGKSMLLHVLISSLALTYSPDELQLYLIDFKEGVEFKLYAEKRLPHARVIAIRSEPEFGLSVLEGLVAELERRGELFRKASETYGEVQDLASYRNRTGKPLPRILLIIDEFQVLFADDYSLNSRATQLLEHIARQGRSVGVHLLLVSQTLAGSANLPRPTLSQMSVRIALRCDESDARLIFDDKNPAARDLIRPGEAVYNDGSGKIEANSEFQVAFLNKDKGQREALLDKINTRHAAWMKATGTSPLPLKIFEGDENAEITECSELSNAFHAPFAVESRRLVAWVGEPIAIKNATVATFRRQSRSHLLIVGQDEESARGTMEAVALSLIAQSRKAPTPARIEVVDLTPVDNDFADRWNDLAEVFPQSIAVRRQRQLAETITSVWTELLRRESEDLTREPGRFLIIHNVVRARDLKTEGGYSSSRTGADSALALPKQFMKILRDGPDYGIHVIAWADTLANFRRILERQALDEFDMRIVSQMSETDSSQLVHAKNASELGPHRAIFFSEEDGLMEKFRPYSPAALEWIQQLAGTPMIVEPAARA